MASFYPVKRRDGPVTAEAVAASLRAGHSRQEQAERRLTGDRAPATPAQRLHKALIGKENSASDVLRLAEEAGEDLDANNVATAIHKVAQLTRRDRLPSAAARSDPRFVALATRGPELAAEWSARQLCHVAWSVAALHAVGGRGGGVGGTLLGAVSEVFAARGAAEGVPQDISTFAWALAVVSAHDGPALASTARASIARISEFGMQDLSITAWAFAKLLYDDRRPLLDAIASESLRKLPSFSGRNLANLSWAFATAQQRNLDLCEALVAECSSRISELGPQELPIALWSFAASGYPAEDVFRAAPAQVLGNLHGMDVSHLCNVVWSFARAGPRDEPLMRRVADEAIGRLQDMEPLHLSNLAWAFANVGRADDLDLRRMGMRHAPLFSGIAAAASRISTDLSMQHCSSLMWAFGACLVTDGAPSLADAIDAAIRRSGGVAAAPSSRGGDWRGGRSSGSSGGVEPRHAAGVLWALAELAVPHAPLCGQVLDGCTAGGVDGLASDGPAHLASIAWAAARLPCAASHTGLRMALRSNVDGLVAALAGSAAELSEGRQQNLAAAVRALYDLGLADTAKAFLTRVEDAEVSPGREAWAAWLTGAAASGDPDLEARAWLGLAVASIGDGWPHDGPRRAAVLNAAALRALVRGRPDLAARALERLGAEDADRVSSSLLRRLPAGLGAPLEAALLAGAGAAGEPFSPRGEYMAELRVLRALLAAAPLSADGAGAGAGAAVGAADAALAAAVAVGEGGAGEGGGGGAAEGRRWSGGEEAAVEIFNLGAGPRGAALDAAARLLPGQATGPAGDFGGGPSQLVVMMGCGVGCAAVRMAATLANGAQRILACEVDPLRASAAMNLIYWTGLEGIVEVWIGRGEQLLPRLRREFGVGSVSILVLDEQGAEYHEELKRAEELGLLADGALVVADAVLRPRAPELLWRVCCTPAFQAAAAVDVGSEWVLVARRAAQRHLSTSAVWWPPAPESVRQARFEADEARRRSPAWRQRDRLRGAFASDGGAGAEASAAAEAEASIAAYVALGCSPVVLRPSPHASGRFSVELPTAIFGS